MESEKTNNSGVSAHWSEISGVSNPANLNISKPLSFAEIYRARCMALAGFLVDLSSVMLAWLF